MGDILKIIGGPLVGAVGTLAGAALQSNGADNAAKISAQTAQNALDFQKQIYQQQLTNRQPFLDQAKSSLGTLADLASQNKTMALPPAYGPYGSSSSMPIAQSGSRGTLGNYGTPQPMGAGMASPAPGGPSSMVQMVYPQTGERSSVPAAQVKYWQSKGAQVVG